jgi:hypothetical protein
MVRLRFAFMSKDARIVHALHRVPWDRSGLNLAGQHWPNSRYVVISLSFDIQGADVPTPWFEGWRCVHDLKTGAFSVPASFADYNAKTVKTPGSDRN